MLRWAILGTSFISDTMAAAIAASPGSTCTVVAGQDATRLEAFRARHGIDRATTSIDEAVSGDDVDVVYVGVPNHLHHKMVVKAAGAGKAIVSEKSLTISMAQADELLTAVDGRVFFVEGLMYLAHPVLDRFVGVLTDGRLGELRAIDASYVANIAHLVNPLGRGAIYNLGCYPASLVQLVIDRVSGDGTFDTRKMSATGTVSIKDTNVTESVAAVRFIDGILATLHTAETYGSSSRFEVQGTKGTLRFVTNPWLPRAGENSFVWTGFDGSHETITVDGPLDAFDNQVRMVERSLAASWLEAQRPSPRLRDSRAVMHFLTDWEAAARYGAGF